MQVIAHAWNSWYADHEEQKLFKDELAAKEESLKYGRERCHDLEKSLKDQDGTIFNLMTRIEQLETQLRGFQAHKEARIQDMARIEQLETQLRGFQARKEARIEDQETLRLQLQVSFL
jgi:septal ring factor EnvC (AmiA/AmiB activator)